MRLRKPLPEFGEGLGWGKSRDTAIKAVKIVIY